MPTNKKEKTKMQKNPALKYFYEAQTSYNNDQDYRQALKKASQGLYYALKNSSFPNSSEILQQCLELTNEILVVVWSQMLDDDKGNVFDEDYFIPAMKMCSLLDGCSRKKDFSAELTQLNELLCNIDHAWKEEFELIKEMKEFCDEDGRETNPKECAKVFQKIANLYIVHELSTETAVYVYCLLISAKSRNANLDTSIERAKLDKWISTLGNFRLADIEKIGRQLKADIDRLRKAVEDSLEKIPKISGKNKREQVKIKEEEKIQVVQKLFEEVECNFVEIMKKLSQKCIRILGTAPCPFFQTSIMPRHKINPYCSFQNIIVINDPEEAQNCRQYFNRYNLLLNLAIASLGESPLHDVGIPFFVDANQTKWFYDEIGLSGLHVRKSYLDTNVIQTVDEYIDQFGSDRLFRKEMHFLQTFLTGGDVKLFKETQVTAYGNIPHSSVTEEVFLKLNKIFYKFSPSNVHMERLIGACNIDIEHAVRNIIPHCISGVGAMNGITEQSCFKIVKVLHDQGDFNVEQVHNLCYALAIVYEIILKKYMQRPSPDIFLSRRTRVSISDVEKSHVSLFEVVGKQSTLEFIKILVDLQNGMQTITDSSSGLKKFFSIRMRSKDFAQVSNAYMHFRLYKEAVALLGTKSTNLLSEKENIILNLNQGISHTCLMNTEKAESSLLMAYALLTSLSANEKGELFVEMLNTLTYMGLNAIKVKNFSELRQYFDQAKELCEMNLMAISHDKDIYLQYFMLLDVICSVEYVSGEFTKAFELWSQLEGKIADYNKQNLSLMEIGIIKKKASCLFQNKNYKKALSEYYRGLNAYNLMSDAFNVGVNKTRRYSHIVADILSGIAACSLELNRLERAESFCDQALRYVSSIPLNNFCDISFCKLVLAKCQLKKLNYKKASSAAFDAFNCAFIDNEFSLNRTYVLRECIQVVFNSALPMEKRDDKDYQLASEDMHTILHSASAMYTIFSEREEVRLVFERDMTILIHVIQTCMFEIGDYRSILHSCKCYIESDTPKKNFAMSLVEPIFKNELLHRYIIKHNDHLLQIFKYQSSRECISFYGAMIIFIGYLHKVLHNVDTENSMAKFNNTINREPEEIQQLVLFSASKLSVGLIKQYIHPLKEKNALKEKYKAIASLIEFATDVCNVIKTCGNLKDILKLELIELLTMIGESLFSAGKHKKALVKFHDALKLEETIVANELDIRQKNAVSYLKENIKSCVQLNHSKKSIMEPLPADNDLIDIFDAPISDMHTVKDCCNQAKVFFKNSDFVNAAKEVEDAFYFGEAFLQDSTILDLLFDINKIIVRCGLNKTVDIVNNDTINEDEEVKPISKSTENVLSVVKRNLKIPKMAEVLQPLLYSMAHCNYALGEYKTALKHFKTALKALKYDEEQTTLKFSLSIKVGKTLMHLGKHAKAQIMFENFLSFTQSMNENDVRTSQVHSYLAQCLLEQNQIHDACRHAIMACYVGNGQTNELVKENACSVILNVLEHQVSRNLNLD